MIRIKRKKVNPTDHEFLKKIEIRKEIVSYKGKKDIIYRVFLYNEEIGYVEILKDHNFVLDIEINSDYHRRGLATYLYNYIEADLGIKLRPSKNQLSDGKAFWQNRLKKQNPTDKDFLSQVKIQKVLNKEYISYEAFYNNKYIAGVDFDPKLKTIWDVWVGPNYRRKGLATFIYNKIEKDQKIKLKPSETLFPDGQEFWKARLKTG